MSSSDNPTLNEMELTISEPTEKSSTDNSCRLVKAREKPVDKRKAQKKADSFSDTDLSSQKTPMKKLKMTTTASGYEEMNMNETELLKDDDSKQVDPLSESAEASSLGTTVEGNHYSQIKGKDEDNKSRDSNNSDKFYSQIKEIEEKEKSLSISPVLEDPGLTTISSISDGLDNKNAAVASWAKNKKSTRKGKSRLNLESLLLSLPSSKPVHVYMKILDPTTNSLIYETKADWIVSQFGRVKNFLSDHKMEISSKLSGSGYSAADISSQKGSGSEVLSRPRQVSLGSRTPRRSDASTGSLPIINQANDGAMTRRGRRRGRGRGRGRGGRQYIPNEAAFSSTMIIPNVEPASTSNGEDHSNGINAIVNMGTTSSVELTTVRKQRRRKTTPRKVVRPLMKTEQKEGASGTERSMKLFNGIQFLLTTCGGSDPPVKTVTVESYDKDEYRELITTHGGVVLEMDQAVHENHEEGNMFLISDNFARTVKYIYALAAGTPCVSYKWIQACVEAENLVDFKEYQLNAGESLETGATIPAHNRKPLRGVKVYVTAVSDELLKHYKPILLAAEVSLLQPVKAEGKKAVLIPPETEILVTDMTCDDKVLEFAEKAGIPFVKPEWLVQTIITGKKVDFAGHIRYSVTAEESGDEEDNDNN